MEIQRDILKLYRQDARRYCEGLDSAKILDVYDSAPAQLAKEYKKSSLSPLVADQGGMHEPIDFTGFY